MSKIASPKTKTRKTELGSITGRAGRDEFIVAKALAYAIQTISSLPECRQERSDRHDMTRIFEAMFSEQLREIVTDSVRFHLNPDAAREQVARLRASAPAGSIFAKATI